MADEMTRRDFMRRTALAALAASLGSETALASEARSRVVLIRDPAALKDGQVNGPVVRDMLDQALSTLLDRAGAPRAFRQLVGPGDVVGVKSNVWPYLPTPPELEDALRDRVIEAGVKPDDVAVDDRGVRSNPVFQRATAIINVRPLRTHYWSGIGGCMKNLIMFAPSPSRYHPGGCADLALLFKLPALEGKVRLHVLVALTPLFHGRGPHHFDKRYLWPYQGLIVGADPVAVDAIGLELIRAKRRDHFGRETELPTPPSNIRLAEVKHGLGVSDPARIDLIRLGWREDALI
ncbi:MAG: DUF362 domain-containing protein [Proteobacteria bacterium]|nr:DUF362 domain-containing protein [Pseudomonadota bacterium]